MRYLHLAGIFVAALLTGGPGERVNAADSLPQFFQNHCISCHHGKDAANGLAFEDMDRIVSMSRLSLEDSDRIQRALNAIKTGLMPPVDADQPTQQQRLEATNSIHQTLLQKTEFGGTLLRRLSLTEYVNSIKSIFGFEYQLPNSFPKDRIGHGFDNSAEGLVVSAPLMESYFHSAIEIADRVIPPPPKPAVKTKTEINASDLVISYSSGAVIDGTMRLAFDWNVLFRSTTWPEKWEAKRAGTYRIRVSASQLLSKNIAFGQFAGPMKLEVRARSLNGKDSEPVLNQRLLATFDVKQDDPQEFEFMTELYPQETPVFYFANGPVSGEKKTLEQLTLQMFKSDPRLYAGWRKQPQTNGGRGGLGWARVKAVRDSKDLDLESVDTSEVAMAKLARSLSSNPGNYGETMVFQFYEEGPALELHKVSIEGPFEVIQTPEELAQEKRTSKFLGELAVPTSLNDKNFNKTLSSFYAGYLTKLFRRPVTEQNIMYFTQLTATEAKKSGSILAGIHLGIRTSLMSPNFLYRGHQAGELDSHDLATRLAFFLTNAPPDAALIRAANASQLGQSETLTEHTDRLLTGDDANQFVSRFVRQWLGIDDLDDIMPDTRLFASFNKSDQEAMVIESERFFKHLLDKNLPIETFIMADFTFANERLASTIYGLNGVKGGFKKVQFPEGSPYGGILGQASVMMATSNGVDTLPVTRGVWVLENILDDAPPAPPENVPAITPDTANANTIREVLAAHRKDSACASCHRSIDPIGFVLENFDPIGRWRENYPVLTVDTKGVSTVEEGLAIDPVGIYKDGTSFKDIHDLKEYVADNIDMFSLCLAKKLTEYATGRHPSYSEIVELQHLIVANRKRGNGFRDLILSIVNSRTFRTK